MTSKLTQQFLRTGSILICFLLGLQLAALAQGSIKGIIKNELGEPLPGANVMLANTTTNFKTYALTDSLGLFRFTHIATGSGYTIAVSYVGYEPQTFNNYVLKDGEQLAVDIKLRAKNNGLTEVVVVGYGKQSRKALSTSISTITQESFNRGGFSNPAQLMQGKVAGLNITRSGDPNALPSISLRGPSTLRTDNGAMEPFYVIDGVPGADFRLVAPDDITDISVLKDAAATAIYGTRAANGVIMVTTKAGQQEGSTVAYNGYVGVEHVARRIHMMNAGQLTDYLKKNNLSLDPSDALGADTDWQKAISRTGMLQNHNLSLNGGSKNTRYSAGVNYFDNKGILQDSRLQRLIARANLSQRALNDHLKLGLNITTSSSTQDMIPNQDIVLYNSLRYLPTVPVQQNGVYTENLQRVQYYNPVALQNNASYQLKTNITLINATAQVQLPLGLQYNLSLSYQKELDNSGSYAASKYALKLGLGGEAYRSSYESNKKVAESYFTYDKTAGRHNINLVAGYSWQEDVNNDGFQANNRNYPTDDLGYSNIGLGSPTGNFRTDWGSNNYQKLRLISFYGRANYNYANKYLAQVSVRRDGSSAFGINNRWGTFPAFAVAWRISQEGFMRGQHLFTDLKLRAGYGVTGNSIGFNPLISKIRYGAAGTFYNNGSFVNSIFATQNANPDLKWEKTAMTNLGIDASLLKGMLNITAEYYDKKTSDLIWAYPVSTTQYYVSTYTANVGAMRNKGVEITISATPVRTRNFRWQSDFNLSHNKNLLTSLSNNIFKLDSIPQAEPGGQGQTGTMVQLLKPGYPIGQFFTFKYAGKNDNGVSQYYDHNGKLTTSPQNFTDYYYAGSAQPKLLLGWSNTFNYRHFDLNIFIRSALGGKLMNATLADLNRPADARSYNLPVFSANESPADINAYRYSDRYIENASYVRIDNLTLGYTFPYIKGIKSLRVYVTGNNLAVITNYRGIDPEVGLGGLTPGIDNKNYYPRTRSFLLGLNASF